MNTYGHGRDYEEAQREIETRQRVLNQLATPGVDRQLTIELQAPFFWKIDLVGGGEVFDRLHQAPNSIDNPGESGRCREDEGGTSGDEHDRGDHCAEDADGIETLLHAVL